MHADVTPIAAEKTREELDETTRAIIGAAQKVSRVLGTGFLERVYENALSIELRRIGLEVEQQRAVHVRYGGEIVGDYFTDLFVSSSVIVEIKAVKGLERIHQAQCVHYLRATGLRVCLLLNFGHTRLEVKRIVCNF
jgi:GxxExxY protein